MIYDQLEAPSASTFEWRLHSPTEMKVAGQAVHVENGGAACEVTFLQPTDLQLSLTDKYDVPPRPRIKVKEWHLTAATPTASEAKQFVTVIRPHRLGQTVPTEATLAPVEGGYVLRAKLTDGAATVLLRSRPGPALEAEGLECKDSVAAVRFDAGGRRVAAFSANSGRNERS